MASTTLDPIAEAIKDVLSGLALTPPVNGLKWERGDLGALPAAAVHVPELELTDIDEPESRLGTDDWNLTYLVSFYFDLDDAVTTQGRMVEFVEAFIRAVKADPTLGLAADVCDEAKVVSARPFTERDRNRPLAGYECRVQVLALVAP